MSLFSRNLLLGEFHTFLLGGEAYPRLKSRKFTDERDIFSICLIHLYVAIPKIKYMCAVTEFYDTFMVIKFDV